MTLVDTEARTRIATDLTTNLFVEAGAGTGKTQSLVNRILGLVTTGTFPNGIADLAAITFTENAAAELRNRVRQQLDRAVADPALAADERMRFRAALASLDDASLSTLHGFALRLLSDFTLEADLPLGFTVQDDIRAGLARDLWWARSVDAALEDPALTAVWTTCLALELTPRALRVIADRMQADWDQLESMAVTPPTVPRWDMPAVVGPLREAVRRYADVGPEGDPLTTYLRGPLRTLLDDLDAEPDDLGRASVLLNQAVKTRCGDRAARKKAGTPKSKPVDILVQADSAWQARLSAVRTACIEQLVCWLRDAVLDDAARRQTEGSLHFHDLLVLARRLLQKPQVREALHHRWPVIMVDEFQDTDPLQVEIVHLLASATFPDSWQECDAAGGRLFFVGDPKQSIYRFRRADVELYNAVRETIAVRPQLVQNFRSHPGILRVVNHSLRKLMDGKPGQVPYAELMAAREEVPGDKGPNVLLLGKGHATDMAGVRQEEAAHVATICRQAAGHWTVRDGRLAACAAGGAHRPA